MVKKKQVHSRKKAKVKNLTKCMKTIFEKTPEMDDLIKNELAKKVSSGTRQIAKHLRILYLEDELKITKQQEENDSPSRLYLLNIFDSTSKYEIIMGVLVEKQYCGQDKIWKDEAKGNRGLLAAILKFLHTQGYYKDKKRPTNKEIMEIAKNTFGWEMKIDTIKKAKPDNFDLSFIPLASTIE